MCEILKLSWIKLARVPAILSIFEIPRNFANYMKNPSDTFRKHIGTDFRNCWNSRDAQENPDSFKKISGRLRIKHDADRGIAMIKRLRILTFLERGSLVFLQPLHRDRFQPDPGRRIFLQNVPHVLLAEDEQVWVAHRSHAGCSSVTCVNVAIYWLSGCVKLSIASGWGTIDRPDRSFRRASIVRARLTRRLTTQLQ